MATMKVIQFPTKEEPKSTVKISYESSGKSFYQQLNELDEDEAQRVLSGLVYVFEKACKKRLEELRK